MKWKKITLFRNGAVLPSSSCAAALLASCVSAPEDVSSIRLHAFYAGLETDAELKFEASGNRECIGWWTSTEDKIFWDFKVVTKGTYNVTAKVACTPDYAGSSLNYAANYGNTGYAQVDMGGVVFAGGYYTNGAA